MDKHLIPYSSMSSLRGHKIYWDGKEFRYSDNHTATAGDRQSRDCGSCALPNRKDEHDACIGELPGDVINACCGHGEVTEAYIQYSNKPSLRGVAAVTEMQALVKSRLQKEKNVTEDKLQEAFKKLYESSISDKGVAEVWGDVASGVSLANWFKKED